MMAAGRMYTLISVKALSDNIYREWAQRVKPSDNLIIKEE